MPARADSAIPAPASTPADPVAIAVGERVAEERGRRGMRKEQLAAAAGLASRYLWRVEDGRQNITLRNLAAIASGLGVSLSDLMRGVEEKAAKAAARLAAEAAQPEATANATDG